MQVEGLQGRWGWTPRPHHSPFTGPRMCKANKILRNNSRLGERGPKSQSDRDLLSQAGVRLFFRQRPKTILAPTGVKRLQSCIPGPEGGSLENHILRQAEERVLEKMEKSLQAHLQSQLNPPGLQCGVALPSIAFLVRFILRSSMVASANLAG